LAKKLGNSTRARFGDPVAYENDAERANAGTRRTDPYECPRRL